MTKEELKALCIFLMCHDEPIGNDYGTEVHAYASRQAILHGFLDWVDAYHKL